MVLSRGQHAREISGRRAFRPKTTLVLRCEHNMEIKGATLLYTLAGLMITFAGFSALLLTLRPAAGARLSLLDRYLAKMVMTHIFELTAGATAAGAICALRHSGKVDLARLWCAFCTTDSVSSGHLPTPTPQGGRPRTAARNIRGLRCIRLRCDTGDAWLRFRRPPLKRRSLHHGVDDRLLYGHFRLRNRARCHALFLDYPAIPKDRNVLGANLAVRSPHRQDFRRRLRSTC